MHRIEAIHLPVAGSINGTKIACYHTARKIVAFFYVYIYQARFGFAEEEPGMEKRTARSPTEPPWWRRCIVAIHVEYAAINGSARSTIATHCKLYVCMYMPARGNKSKQGQFNPR